MNTNISSIFLRFWDYTDLGKVSSTVLAVQNTPHYHLARKTLECLSATNSSKGIWKTQEFRNYEAYAEHEASSYGRRLHLASRYVELVEHFYTHGFDLQKHPVSVARFGHSGSEEPVFYVIDGNHRVAYAAAYSDVMQEPPMPVTVSLREGIPHWPEVEAIDYGDRILR